MTKPEHVTQWWGRLGDGYSVPVCEIDLRVGGRWRFVNRHPQGEAAFHGEYREIAPPGRLVFTEIFEEFPDIVSVVTAEFTEEGGKTRLMATVRYPSRDVRDMVISPACQGRGHQLRPPRRPCGGAAAILTGKRSWPCGVLNQNVQAGGAVSLSRDRRLG